MKFWRNRSDVFKNIALFLIVAILFAIVIRGTAFVVKTEWFNYHMGFATTTQIDHIMTNSNNADWESVRDAITVEKWIEVKRYKLRYKAFCIKEFGWIIIDDRTEARYQVRDAGACI